MSRASNLVGTARQMRRWLAASLACASLALAGCVDDYTAAAIHNPATHHPIGYGTSPETLFVELAPNNVGLSRNQSTDVWRFINRYKKESTGSLRIEAPGSAGGHMAASRALRQVEAIVEDAGVDPRAVQMARLGGKAGHAGAVTLSYDRTVAVPPNCGDWSDDLGKNRERLPYNNFGCATQRNLALTVANGRDLQMPQEETPRSSERRSTNWSAYTGASSQGGSTPEVSGAPKATTK
jgi:pilus assembly protein CpaD